MLKQDIRKEYKQKRSAISLQEKEKLEDLMLIQFQELNLPCAYLLSYAPIEKNNEYNPFLAEEFMAFKNHNVQLLYPVIERQTQTMQAAKINSSTSFKLNSLQIAEPINPVFVAANKIDVLFVPLLAFSELGYRVGYGKGYYDKFITLCKPDIICVGFSFFEPIEISDVNEHDKKLDFCITPNKVYSF
jgi:5-formyltetrahydrofolate cyclo-ligase